MPLRLRLSRKKGFHLQALAHSLNGLPAVKVDRSTRWGNPYATGDRDADVFQFELGLLALPEAQYRALLVPLIGKNLACWCPDGQRCHADVWLLHAATLADKGGRSLCC